MISRKNSHLSPRKARGAGVQGWELGEDRVGRSVRRQPGARSCRVWTEQCGSLGGLESWGEEETVWAGLQRPHPGSVDEIQWH